MRTVSPPDPDVPLDLQAALNIIYDESDYDRTLNYRQPPPEPALSPNELAWLDAALCNAELRQ